MKQHITKEQLNELSKEAGNKFSDWFYRREGYITPQFRKSLDRFEEKFGYKSLPPESEITIGQMIEFLMDYEYFEFHCDLIGEPIHTVRNLNWEYDEELCDFLWEEVKSVLNK